MPLHDATQPRLRPHRPWEEYLVWGLDVSRPLPRPNVRTIHCRAGVMSSTIASHPTMGPVVLESEMRLRRELTRALQERYGTLPPNLAWTQENNPERWLIGNPDRRILTVRARWPSFERVTYAGEASCRWCGGILSNRDGIYHYDCEDAVMDREDY